MLETIQNNLPAETNAYQHAVALHDNDIRTFKKIIELLQALTHDGLMAAADGLRGGIYQPDQRYVESFITRRSQNAWRGLLANSVMRQYLCARTKDQLSKQIQDDCPPFNLETIEATLGNMMEDAYKHFSFGLVDALGCLDYKSYKTNTPFKLGEKIIVTGAFGATHWAYDKQNHITDLERCLNIIEQLPVKMEDAETVTGAAKAAGWQTYKPTAGEAESRHFTFRWFKNGNGHLRFKNKETLHLANLVISDHFNGRAIPTTAA